jgi:hypothetical protein
MAAQIKIIIKTFVRRRADIQERIRPEAENGRRHDMGGGMAQPLKIGHFVPLFEGFALDGVFSGFSHNSNVQRSGSGADFRV